MRLTISNCLTAVVIIIIAISAPAFAQDATPSAHKGQHGERRNGRAAKMLAKLDLTQEQKDKIKAIQEAQKAKIQPIRENKSLTDEQKKEQMKNVMKDTMKQVMALLTPEQKTKLKELRQAREEKKDPKAGKGEKAGQ